MSRTSGIASIRGVGKYGQGQSRRSSVFERLSAGVRIVSADEECEAAAVSLCLGSRGLAYGAAERSISDAASIVHLADQALVRIGGLLTEMRQIAMRSADGACSEAERLVLDAALRRHLDDYHTAIETTEYQDKPLLVGPRDQVTTAPLGGEDEPGTVTIEVGGLDALFFYCDYRRPSAGDAGRAREILSAVDLRRVLLIERLTSLEVSERALRRAMTRIGVFRANLGGGLSQLDDVDRAEALARGVGESVIRHVDALLTQAQGIGPVAKRLITS